MYVALESNLTFQHKSVVVCSVRIIITEQVLLYFLLYHFS
jgi:hypothetical protein